MMGRMMGRHTRKVRARRHAPRRIACTLLDATMQNTCCPLALFFRRSVPEATLMDGLQRALDSYPLFAGRFRMERGQLWLDCNNAGMPVTVIRRRGDSQRVLGDLLHSGARHAVNSFDAKRCVTHGEPVARLRIVYYGDRSMSVGITWSHALGDLATGMALLRAWAAAVAGQPIEEPELVTDRAAFLAERLAGPRGAPPGMHTLNNWEFARFALYALTEMRDQAPLTLHFSQQELQVMKQTMAAQAGTRLSTNDALCAHIFSAIARADHPGRDRLVSFVVNFRRRAGLPEDSLGNMLTYLNVPMAAGTPEADFARRIRDEVDHFDERHMNYYETEQMMEREGGFERADRFIPRGVRPLERCLLVTNVSKVGMYELDLGAGRPWLVTPIGLSPAPWIGTICDGLHGQGLLFNMPLPRAIVHELSSPAGLQRLHRFRPAQQSRPGADDQLDQLPWIH